MDNNYKKREPQEGGEKNQNLSYVRFASESSHVLQFLKNI
jgi:hypothetical protein